MNTKAKAAKEAPASSNQGLIAIMAREQHMDPNAFALTVKATCFEKDCSREQFMAFLMIANEHKLSPITREIYAFEKAGKITPIVSIDGWLKIINSHPDFDGMEFVDNLDDEGSIVSITSKIYRKDRDRPTIVTEYLSECKRDTMPWKQWPIRMLRHKATIQGARYAFGFAGIYDADEAERIRDAKTLEGVATIVPEEVPQTAAKRIISKAKAKVSDEDLAPPEASHETVAVDPETGEIHDAQIEAEIAEIALDDIPDLKKGSEIPTPELSDEHKAYVEDMEK